MSSETRDDSPGVKLGDRFRIVGDAPQAITNAKGRRLANYLPAVDGQPIDYAVTPRNIAIVRQMVADGVAAIGGAAEARRADRVASSLARLRGTVRIDGGSGEALTITAGGAGKTKR